jgi:hypothetical protein
MILNDAYSSSPPKEACQATVELLEFKEYFGICSSGNYAW